jgi:hypothetical protein
MNLLSIYSGLYWLTRLDHIRDMCTGVLITSIIITAALLLWHEIVVKEDSGITKEAKIDKLKRTKIRIKYIISIAIFSVLILVFIPSKNEAIFIVAGGKTIDYIQKDTSLCKLPYQTTKFISEYLDKKIKEIEGK